MPVIHAVTNFSGNAGDSNAVISIASKVKAETFIEHKLDNPDGDAVKAFADSLNANNDHVLVIAGAKGLDFLRSALQNSAVQATLAQGRLIISWSGHQVPKEIKGLEDDLNVVGVLDEAVEFEPAITKTFGDRLIRTNFVANTLTLDDLKSGEKLKTWNATHPSQQIPTVLPENVTGIIGAFLPGDAERLGNAGQNFFTEDQAYALGLALGRQALTANKFLLMTNGPRMGKYDHTSDPANPKLREPKPHIKGAETDPVTTAFLKGIEKSGLPTAQYQFIDFIAGDSAYIPIACALYKLKDAVVYYGAESISEVQLASFFNTIAIKVKVMTELSTAFLEKCLIWQRVACAELAADGSFHMTHKVDREVKALFISQNPERDAQSIANKITEELRLAPAVRATKRSNLLLHTATTSMQKLSLYDASQAKSTEHAVKEKAEPMKLGYS